jgi:serpin B
MTPATRKPQQRRLMVSIGACACLLLAGCGESDELENVRDARVFTELTPEIEPAVRSTNQLATALYHTSAAAGENLFFSPFSISVALGMTYAGAVGVTAEEMRSVLAIEADDDAYHHALGALNADLTGPHRRGYQLLSANALFGEQSTAFAAPYLDVLATSYQAPLHEVSFVTDPSGARDTVNQWVSDGTQAKIPDLVPADLFTSDTRFALVNAVYFVATWAARFDPESTSEQPFLLEDGSETSVRTMGAKGKFRTAADDRFTLLELDYADRELSLGLFLPNERGGLGSAEAELDSERIDALFEAATDETCSVSVPRFAFSGELPLERRLIELGMRTVFSDSADFSAMVDTAEPLYLTDALHQADVRVDETGTEAAAATAIVGSTRSAASCEVRADHPFAFVIRDRGTGTLLFMGRVADPTQD